MHINGIIVVDRIHPAKKPRKAVIHLNMALGRGKTRLPQLFRSAFVPYFEVTDVARRMRERDRAATAGTKREGINLLVRLQETNTVNY